jgi:hypothetical protein
MAVDETISSSKPNIFEICCSIHWERTGLLILERWTLVPNEAGNLVDFSSFVMAWSSDTLAVPLMEGISPSLNQRIELDGGYWPGWAELGWRC